MTGGQFRLDDVEVAGSRPTEWIWFGEAGREALGPDRPGRRPCRRDSSHVGRCDDDPARERPQIGA